MSILDQIPGEGEQGPRGDGCLHFLVDVKKIYHSPLPPYTCGNDIEPF